jgi:hypothetical protein
MQSASVKPTFFQMRILQRMSVNEYEDVATLRVGKKVLKELLELGWVEWVPTQNRKRLKITSAGLEARKLTASPHPFAITIRKVPGLKMLEPRIRTIDTRRPKPKG